MRGSVNDALFLGKAYSIDHRIVRPDGTERIVHEVADVRLSSDGRPVEMIGTVHDITEQKGVEQALRKSETKFRGLLETAYDPILIVNAKGAIEFANQQTKKWLGYEPEELLGKPIEILVPEGSRTKHVGQRAQYMKHPTSRAMGRNLQLSAVRKDGTEFPVDISLSPYETEHGTIHGFSRAT